MLDLVENPEDRSGFLMTRLNDEIDMANVTLVKISKNQEHHLFFSSQVKKRVTRFAKGDKSTLKIIKMI